MNYLLKLKKKTCPELKHFKNLNEIVIMLSSERFVQFVVSFVKKSWSLTA